MTTYNIIKSGSCALPRMKYCTHAFTMSEILVIIIIICLLAGFLMSTLTQSLEQSKLTIYKRNLPNIDCADWHYYSDKSNRQCR